jgi:hypothetical protein
VSGLNMFRFLYLMGECPHNSWLSDFGQRFEACHPQ